MGIDKFIEKVCVQPVVWWQFDGSSGFGGPSFKDPVQIKTRWTDEKQVIQDDEGNEIISNAWVLLTQDVSLQDYLYLGTLTDIGSEPDPLKVDGAYQIKRFEKVPMIFSTEIFVRKAFL